MNPISAIASILFNVAPLLSNVLGGGAGPTWVVKGLEILAKVLNTSSSPAEIEAKLKELNVNKEIALKQLDAMLQLQMMSNAFDLQKLEIESDAAIAHDQAEIVKIDAASESKFKSWYRPTAAWVSVVALGYNLLICPIISMFGISACLANESLLTLAVVNLLGIGSMRSWEKYKGLTK